MLFELWEILLKYFRILNEIVLYNFVLTQSNKYRSIHSK